MTSSNQKPKFNQISTDLLQPLTEEQAETLAGGVSTSVIFALNQSAAQSKTSTSIVECLVFDIGGDAVIAEGPNFFTKLPFVSSMPVPQ